MSPKVLITRNIPDTGMDLLKESNFECIINDADLPIRRRELETLIAEVDGLIAMLNDRIDAPLLERAPSLKVVANLAAGIDNIDISACTGRGIAVTNTPGVLTEATADLTFALILAAARRVIEADHYLREGRFNGWDPLLFRGTSLQGKTLGIIGMGRIGQAVAKRALAFNMKITYFKRSPLPAEVAARLKAEYHPLDDLVKNADFLSLHLPYTPGVHHLINSKRLDMMKPGAYLINTARGALVDEKSLVKHLRAGKIAGAALDVFEHEPLLAPGLADLDNVTLLPHLGSATAETRSAMARMAAESVCCILAGEKPENILNPQVFEQKSGF